MRLDPSIRWRPLLVWSLGLIAIAIPAAAQTTTDPTLVVTPFVTGLSQPIAMAFLGPDDFLVTQKANGQVRRVIAGVLQPGNVLDVNVNSSSERGLLGIAIQQGTPIRVFLYYTEAQGSDGGTPLGNRVYRYDWNPAGPGSLVNPQMILDLPVTPGPNHNGGQMVLDGSGLLYLVMGELNRNGQLQNFPAGAPPDDTGVIFRVNSDGTAAAGNPYTPYCSITTTTTCTQTADCPGGETCTTQVARYLEYGLRNSFGLTFDPMTGALWDTENGPNVMDEVNLVTPGLNSGWEQIMGPDALDPQGVGDLWNMPGAGLTYSDPEFSWNQTVAPTGILFPVGSTWGPSYDNVVLVGDNNLGNLYALPLNGSRTGFDFSATPALLDLVADTQAEANLVRLGQGFGPGGGGITDIKLGPDNDVYFVAIGNGTIYRIHGPVPVELQGFSVE